MRKTSSNSPIGSILFGLAFIAAGVFSTFIFSQIGEISCTRPEPSALTCTQTMKLFGLVTVSEKQLPTLQGAHLSESCDEDGCSYRVDLETMGGTIPLVSYYTGGIGAYKQQTDKMNRINAFLADQEEIELVLGTGLSEQLLSFLPLAFIVVGGFIFISGLRQFLMNLDEIR